MRGKMSYSILMSIYEKEKPEYFIECLNSIFSQTLKPSEIVIVKDGLIPPDLEHVLLKFTNRYPGIIKVVPLSENKGLGKALDIGLKSCTNEIVARMDTDDICLPDRFEKQIKFLMDNKEVDIVGSWIKEFEDSTEFIVSTRKPPLTHKDIYEFAKKRNPLNHMTVVFRKKSIEDAGGYLPFLWNEDYYLWVRMLVNGKKFANIPETLVLVRAGSSMITRRGGIKYFIQEMKLQKEFYSLRFINFRRLFLNLIFRGIFRIVPNSLRKVLYVKFLRSSMKG
jgi:glycosyltransferase involved in cell wall biosynthesis